MSDEKFDNRIWRRDDTFNLIGMPEIKMDVSVCKVREKSLIPLVLNFDFGERPLGEVAGVRFEDGEIFAEGVEFYDEGRAEQIKALWGHGDLRLAGFYREVYYKDDTRTEIGSCILDSVSFILESPFGADPGAKI